MDKYKQNLSKLNDLLIKNSDMTFQLKNQITFVIKKALNYSGVDQKQISKMVTTHLQENHPGSWICIVGRNFVANVMHQPGFFIRLSNQKFHFIVYKLRFYQGLSNTPQSQKKQKQISPLEQQNN